MSDETKDNKLSLYHVQDADRPMWVLAQSYGEAIARWKAVIGTENDMDPDDVEDPAGVHYIAEPREVLP